MEPWTRPPAGRPKKAPLPKPYEAAAGRGLEQLGQPGLEQLECHSDFGVSSFVTTEMLLPFFVWGAIPTPVSKRVRHLKSYKRSIDVFVDFIDWLMRTVF